MKRIFLCIAIQIKRQLLKMTKLRLMQVFFQLCFKFQFPQEASFLTLECIDFYSSLLLGIILSTIQNTLADELNGFGNGLQTSGPQRFRKAKSSLENHPVPDHLAFASPCLLPVPTKQTSASHMFSELSVITTALLESMELPYNFFQLCNFFYYYMLSFDTV